MTYRRRAPTPEKPLPTQRSSGVPRGVWLKSGAPLTQPGVVWIKRPMPDGQWPPDRRAPRDDSFRWWIRASCGHPGGAKQFAFYEEKYADVYEHVYRADPCRWSRCPEWRIRNAGR